MQVLGSIIWGMVMTSSLNSLELLQMLVGQIPFVKVHHPSTEEPKVLVGFEPGIEPELSTETLTQPVTDDNTTQPGHLRFARYLGPTLQL